MIAKAKTHIEQWAVKQFKGRGAVLGMIWCFYVMALVYAGALVLAGIIAMSILLLHAGHKKYLEDYELLKDLGKTPEGPVAGFETSLQSALLGKADASALSALATRVAGVEAQAQTHFNASINRPGVV